MSEPSRQLTADGRQSGSRRKPAVACALGLAVAVMLAAGARRSWAGDVQSRAEGRLKASGHSPEGGSGFPPADVEEKAEHGIINWWSWDYGPDAKDPSHRGWPPPFGFALINFAIFVAVLYRFGSGPVRAFIRQRHDTIRRDLDEAARLRREAAAKLEQAEQQLAGVEREIARLLESVLKEAEAEKARIVEAAHAQAARLRSDAERQIQAEIERARIELRRGVIATAVASADRILREQIGADDQHRMAELYVSDLENRLGGRGT